MLNFFANKKVSSLILVISLVIGSFGMAHFAWAGPIDAAVTMVIGWVASLVIVVCGWILTIAISSIITIISYNKFISEPSIVQAWVIVRDLCNMFFILILLVIAFATILRLPNYEWKKLLPKLLIMAVLINFSKTICGLFIDFSQVILLTFANAFSGGGGNFIAMLGVEKFLAVAQSKSTFWGIGPDTLNLTNTVAAMMFVIILLIVATVAMVAIMIVFLMRMIMLWIYIILSPLAYLLMAFPAGQKYASQWWSEFIKYLINGPVLAFFIWLALIVMSNAPKFENSIFFDQKTSKLEGAGSSQLIQALQSETFVPFILAIGLLVGGLMISQQIGGLGAAWGMNAIGNLKSRGLGLTKKAALGTMKGALGLSSWGARKLKLATGYEIRPTKIIAGFREALADKKRREEITAESKSATALRKGGVTGLIKGLGASRDLTEAGAKGFLWHRGWFGKKSMIAQTIKAGGLRKDIAKMEKDLAKATEERAADKVADLTKQIAGKTKELETTATPYTYFADQKRNAAIREQVSKIGDNDNEEDLIAMFNAAVARGDKETASAVYITASKVGHANEIIQSQKADKDVKDDFGNVVIKEGGYLDESVYGMNALTNQVLMKKLGMSEQEAFNVQSQVSTNAKSIGHFNLTESIGVKNGMLYQRTGEHQQQRARGELRKVDPEKFVRNFNRLAYGDEEQHYDEKQGKIVRNFKINKLGMSNILENAAEISKEVGNRRFNHNAAMNLATDIEGIKKYYEALDPDERTFYDPNKDNGKDQEKGGDRDYMEVIEEIRKFGISIKEGEDRAKAVQDRIKTIQSPSPSPVPTPQTP